MNAEILSVGTELLLGDIANTDAQYISQRLAELGINVYYHTVVGDNPGRIRTAVETAKGRSDLIVTTGGLGPTYDDITKETLADSFGLKLVMHEPSLRRIRDFFAGIGREMTINNEKQAMLPEGCDVFDNDWGTAPACAFTAGGVSVIMLPGPPRECNPLVRERAMPWLRARMPGTALVSRVVRIFGMGESSVEALLKERMEAAQNPTIAPYVKDGEVLLRVTAKAADEARAQEMIDPLVREIVSILGDAVYGVDVPSLEAAAVDLLKARGMTLAVAESCTGGLLSKRITDIPGCSAVFPGGVCTYANSAKERFLGVPGELLQQHGAVSEPVAAAMARGAAEAFGADLGIGITGIAGPDGGTAEKPVGTVFVGFYTKDRAEVLRLTLGVRSRDMVRTLAASHALNLVRKYLLNAVMSESAALSEIAAGQARTLS